MKRDEGLLERWARRSISFPVLAVAWLAATVSLVALPVTALIDLGLRSRLARSRGLIALAAFLNCEVLGLLASFAAWLVSPLLSRKRYAHLHVRLQRLWVLALFGSLRRIYGMTLVIEGAVDLRDPRIILLSRHTSLVDTLLPVLVLNGKWRPRYVLKRELLWDPCLDVVGQRLPNVFVRRGSDDTQTEVRKIAGLAKTMTNGDAAVIFPEGTRFTPARRERVLQSMGRRLDPAYGRARGLRNLLPPHLAGSQGLVFAQPQATVVVLAHTGLENARTLGSLWSGTLIGQEVRVRLRAVAAHEVPRTPEGFAAWLWDAWESTDQWIDASRDRDWGARQIGSR